MVICKDWPLAIGVRRLNQARGKSWKSRKKNRGTRFSVFVGAPGAPLSRFGGWQPAIPKVLAGNISLRLCALSEYATQSCITPWPRRAREQNSN